MTTPCITARADPQHRITPPTHFLMATLASLLLLPALGCTDRTGTAYVEIVNDQGADKAQPIYVDPRVPVDTNEYQRSYLNEGSNIRQHIVIHGPVMIVPVAPTTQK